VSEGLSTTDLIRRSAAYLAAHGVPSPVQTAETLLMRLLGTDRAGLYARKGGLDMPTARLFGRALCQRCKGVPLQHLTGEQQFMDLVLRVSPDVFVPRPETEGLVEAAFAAIEDVEDPAVVDVGTGTGAVALAIKRHRPDARVWATDVSEGAVSLARENAGGMGLAVDVLLGDLLDPVPHDMRGRIDLIVSNPPYVTEEEYEDLPPEVRAEPIEALVGGTEVHRRLVHQAGRWLAPGGWLVVEIGAAQGAEVKSMFESGFAGVEVLPDLAGRDRVVRGRRPMLGEAQTHP
jgi:release factor glutamine methyltransferase